jgi:TRAP-type C4-dicarboxylate transport system substrate-binding protein
MKFINSSLFKKEVEVLSKSNYHVLIPDKGAVWKRGPNRVILSKRPVFTVADYQGLKIRTPEIKLRVRIYSSMGATPTMIPWKEAYLALKQGMVEAITAPLDHVYDMKFHEVAPYITNINEFLQNNMITVDKRKWDRLPDNIKKAMEEAAIETVEWNNSLLDKRVEKDIQKMLDEGACYIRISLKSFMDKFAPLVEEFESEGLWEKGLYEKVQTLK